jgi:hypothetical protein
VSDFQTYSVVGGCDLHVPYKRWSGEPQEEQNYEAIEQWAKRLPGCFGGGALGPVSQNLTHGNSLGLPDNSQFYIDFNGRTDAGNSFGPNFDISAVNQLGILAPGLLTWEGYMRVQSSATTGPSPVVGSWGETTVNDLVTGNIDQISRVPLLCQDFGVRPLTQIFPIGGSAYIDRVNQLQINVQWQTNGSITSFNVDFQVMVNHFPWPKG